MYLSILNRITRYYAPTLPIGIYVLISLFFTGIQATGAENPIRVGGFSGELNEKKSVLKVSGQLLFSMPWHINSDKVEQPYLIATGVVLEDSTAGREVKRNFPQPKQLTLFGETMQVFAENVSFDQYFYLPKLKNGLPRLKLQYQACSDKICLPPKFHPVTISQRSGKSVEVVVGQPEP